MARGTTLIKMLDDLRVAAKLSLNPAHNAQNRDHQLRRLQSAQEELWEEYDWPHLRVERQVPIVAGQRFYDVPEDLHIDRITRLDLFVDGFWQPLFDGISGIEYSVHNSDLDERAWPPRRWQIWEGERIELWPIADQAADPVTRYGYLRFTGIRNLNPLVKDSDTADLDDVVLVNRVAAELLNNEKDIKLALAKANSRLMRLRANLAPRRSFQMFGVNRAEIRRRDVIDTYRAPIIYPVR
jgi:hypothetical protein